VRAKPALFVAFMDAPFCLHIFNPRILSGVIHVLHLSAQGFHNFGLKAQIILALGIARGGGVYYATPP
jgi:hypothetical protein